MSQEINVVIDNLCQKLGTSAQLLIPEMAKKCIAENVFLIVLSIVMMAILLWVTPKVWRYDHDPEDRCDETFWIVIPIALWVLFFVEFTNSMYSLVGWLASPTAKAFERVVGLMVVSSDL